MKTPHWTDRNLQSYLDSAGGIEDRQAVHLRRCVSCRRQLRAYQRLYDLLARPPEEILSKGFAAAVAARAARGGSIFTRFSGEGFWVLVGLLFGLGAWAYLYSMPMLETVRQGLSEVFTDFKPIWTAWSKWNRYLPWLAEGTAALILAALFDRLVALFRTRRMRA